MPRFLARSPFVILLLGFTASSPATAQYVISTFAGRVLPPPGPATSASVGSPRHEVRDSAGNLYFSSNANVFRLDPSGNLTVVAGTGLQGCSGDGAAAIAAQLTFPTGLAMDPAGNLYVADPGCQAIRKIDTHGSISTFASGTGYQLTGLQGMTIDPAGNLYVAEDQVAIGTSSVESGNAPIYAGMSCVLEVTPAGNVSVVAGSGPQGFGGDGQPATQALLFQPSDVVLDSAGNLYIADPFNARIRVVNSQGVINTFAGTGPTMQDGFTVAIDRGDGGQAQSASLSFPTALAMGPAGLYIGTQYGLVRTVSAQGVINTVAGSAKGAGMASGLPVSGVYIGGGLGSSGLVVDAGGVVYAASNNGIWKLPPGGTVTGLAGNSFFSYSGDGGQAAVAQFGLVIDFARDGGGDLFLADYTNSTIRRIASNGTITTVAGGGQTQAPLNGVQGIKANLSGLSSIGVDSSGDVYIVQLFAAAVLKLGTNGILSTFAGDGVPGSAGVAGDGGQAPQADLGPCVRGVAVDSGGSVYISESNCAVNSAISPVRKVTPDGIIHTFARVLNPGPLCIDKSGNVYVVSYLAVDPKTLGFTNPSIVKITPDGVANQFAGGGLDSPGDGEPALNAKFAQVVRLATDAAGNLYFSDTGRIREVDTQGTLTTIAGNGTPGYTGDGGPALSAETSGASAIAVDSSGNIYFGENFNGSSGSAQGDGAIRVLESQAAASVKIGSVVNAGSNLAGPVAPGEIVTIYGSGFGPAQGVSNAPDATGLYEGVVAQTSVLFNGVSGPMIYSYPGQAAAVVPYEATGASVQVAVQYKGVTSTAVTVLTTAASPALLTPGNGTGQAAAVNQDDSINGADHPAPVGSVIVLYATGEGQTSPAGMDGQVTGTTLPKPLLPVTVSIGGQNAQVAYAGEAPDEIAGVMQLNVQIPSGIQTGSSVPVVVKVGSASSPPGVTIAVE